MESEEPMEVECSENEKFEDLLEEGEYVEPNRINRNIISMEDEVSFK